MKFKIFGNIQNILKDIFLNTFSKKTDREGIRILKACLQADVAYEDHHNLFNFLKYLNLYSLLFFERHIF